MTRPKIGKRVAICDSDSLNLYNPIMGTKSEWRGALHKRSLRDFDDVHGHGGGVVLRVDLECAP